ncbi:MAG: DUF4834 family protein [Alistipes sp.]|nr:DUF4834 family protein [Alistipes sp.]
MNILRIIIFGLLAFIERNPIFCIFLLFVAIMAPALFKVVGWIILGIIALFLAILGIGWWRMRKMQRELNNQFRQTASGAGFNGSGSAGGFNGFGGFSTGGMTLEELVRQMHAQADAAKRNSANNANSQTTTTTTTSGSTQKKVSDKVGDYVDFEEVK